LLEAILVAHRYSYFLLLFVVHCLPLWLLLANVLVAYDLRLWLLLIPYRCDNWLLLNAMVVGCSLALWLLFIPRHYSFFLQLGLLHISYLCIYYPTKTRGAGVEVYLYSSFNLGARWGK